MGLIVIRPGLGSTVQDLGRSGYREFGMPTGGAFDQGSHRLANALLGNPPDRATIELTMVGGVYEATASLALSLAGAPFAVRRLRGAAELTLRIPQSFSLAAGDRLVFGSLGRGLRAYLAVKGGWRTALVLGSRSTEARLKVGDVLSAEAGVVAVRRYPDAGIDADESRPIRLIDGPDGPVPLDLIAHEYRVGAESDRVGLRLIGPTIEAIEEPGRASASVAPGAVQVTGGRAIILGVAGGTMGGYPHLGHVISADLDCLGQLRPSALIRFERIGLADARRLDRELIERLAARDRIVAAIARDRLD